MKITTVFLLAFILLFSTVSCNRADVSSSQSYFTSFLASWSSSFNDISELFNDHGVDLVVYGEVTEIIDAYPLNPSSLDPNGLNIYFTDYNFKVEHVIKGNEVGSIVIHQTGAVGKMEIDSDPLFMPGERCLLFLHQYEPGKYFVRGGPQGRFTIVVIVYIL